MLLPGDQIHKINSEDVRDAPRSRVIELVRSADQELVLTISQPPTISVSNTSKVRMQWSRVLFQLENQIACNQRLTELLGPLLSDLQCVQSVSSYVSKKRCI